jgi:hypothetical protein
MSDAVSSGSTASDISDYASYKKLVADIAEEVSRGRTGFGAFRYFSSISRDTMRLAFSSGFFANREKESFPLWAIDKELLHFYLKRSYPEHRHFINQVLAFPSSYEPPCLWALFWALAEAEHEFLFRYIPFWSHEERLTGHLVSQIVERLEDFAPYWASLSGAPESESENHCRIFYADTATARKESITGADFGLVVHARFGKQPEYFKVARFQAKKAEKNGSAVIDFDQVAALLNRPNVGYYIFYHFHDPKKWSLVPTVLSAGYFKHRLEELRVEKAKIKSTEMGKESKNVQESGYDFATFLAFALADPASEHGAYVLTAEDAVRELMTVRPPLSPPSRVMVITLGGGTTVVDWPDLLREYIGFGQIG